MSLRQLEAESIEIIRELTAVADKTAILYSAGKDSSVLIHLAIKAFAPGPIPFPLLHIDTGLKFREMYEIRDRVVHRHGLRLMVESNEEAISRKTNPFDLGTQACCGLLKTEALLSALKKHGIRIAIGGGRRDEEKSRAKERIFSVRTEGSWDPRNQRPEFWTVYNTRLAQGQSLRVFPLSNWTEIDVWKYIGQEDIEVSSLYFARPRKMVKNNNQLFPYIESVSNERPGGPATEIVSRYRTLGCWPCTGAIESSATTVADIVEELLMAKVSERVGRAIDHDEPGSMEQKKREGYF